MNSYFEDIEQHIINQIDKSKARILIAVAWFTNTRLSNTLIKLKKIEIDIIVDNNEINKKSYAIKLLQSNSINIRFINDLNEKYLMHNKFCVIDNKIVLTGSYNWTFNAEKNQENIMVIEDHDIALGYSLQFSRIKNKDSEINAFVFDESEIKSITKSIEQNIINIIAKNIHSLNVGLINNSINLDIENKIRKIIENIQIKTESNFNNPLGVYSDLIKKYGLGFHTKSSQKEKVNSRHKYSLKTIENTKKCIKQNTITLKIKAINNVISSYNELLRKKENRNEQRRIINIVAFLIKERNLLSQEYYK